MPSFIQNYGYTKTLIDNNNSIINNEINWQSNYDGKIANINVNIDDNGNTNNVSMRLTNEDIKRMLGIQPIKTPLEKRLRNDFLKTRPIALEGALINTRRRKKRRRKLRTRRIY
jgi:hypothetical protein